ncbi:MAG: SGNH/GDSL hydrolase family protein [Oscillospiraceae bacterium]|jgi:lysophospholipase L1-like esterase|nr:SGNH/GDSL hydrolase family protein [Oscillospiraceae bacterium]MDD3832815.1 SGNH/GDSL hydrolase family protein [Oscillospiraceae bacterium]MDD4546581.1 SGNH/GDSL hydrolase family protein [Oscillospiraceae bacterium]
MRLLFQGDSITDAGRDRVDPHRLGNGYPNFTAELINTKFSDINWEFINLGISGNRVIDLVDRRQKDFIDIQPDIVSVLIGVNDTWRAFDNNDPTTAEKFEANYRLLLEDIKKNTNAKIIMIEPFLLHNEPNKDKWRSDLNPKIDAVRRLAREFADIFIPMDGIFAAACIDNPPEYWAADGVHPTKEGAKFIAENYLDALSKLLNR